MLLDIVLIHANSDKGVRGLCNQTEFRVSNR